VLSKYFERKKCDYSFGVLDFLTLACTVLIGLRNMQSVTDRHTRRRVGVSTSRVKKRHVHAMMLVCFGRATNKFIDVV